MTSKEETGTMHRSKGGIILKLRGFLSLRLFPTCRDCPQYGQAIVYPRKCYYYGKKVCHVPVFIQAPRLRRILVRKAKDVYELELFMYGVPKCPGDKHRWSEVVNQPYFGLYMCVDCGLMELREMEVVGKEGEGYDTVTQRRVKLWSVM